MRKFVTSVLAAAMIAGPLHAAPWQDQGSEVRPGAFIGAQFKDVVWRTGAPATAYPTDACSNPVEPLEQRPSDDPDR